MSGYWSGRTAAGVVGQQAAASAQPHRQPAAAGVTRIAITQARHHPDAQRYLARRRQNGNTPTEAIRALKRRLSDVVYRALLIDAVVTDEAGRAAAA
jgi:hypothetical protein